MAAAACREVLRPQPLLSYDVYKKCIVGRHRDYKWYGISNKVYRQVGWLGVTYTQHAEARCAIVNIELLKAAAVRLNGSHHGIVTAQRRAAGCSATTAATCWQQQSGPMNAWCITSVPGDCGTQTLCQVA
jgi:hypothetical protein